MTSVRALVPVSRPKPPAVRKPLPLVASERLLPLARRTVVAAAVGFVAEYALRALANRALHSALHRGVLHRAAPTSDVTRTIITEFVIVERGRRRLL